MKTKRGRSIKRFGRAPVRITILAAFLLLAGAALAHNLQTRMTYMFFDPDTQACLDARIEGITPLPGGCAALPENWAAGQPLLQVNDEVGIVIKVVPRDGTNTGVGGHIDFYVPDGARVTSQLIGLTDTYTSAASGPATTAVDPA